MNIFEKGGRVKINPELKPNVLKHYPNVNFLEADKVYIVAKVFQYGSIKLVDFESKFFHSDIFINA